MFLIKEKKKKETDNFQFLILKFSMSTIALESRLLSFFLIQSEALRKFITSLFHLTYYTSQVSKPADLVLCEKSFVSAFKMHATSVDLRHAI